MTERLIVALDHPDLQSALAQVDLLGDAARRYKIGLELYVSAGRAAIDELVARGRRVFLDLKLHDIPETVERAARAATLGGGVDLLTVHASGGFRMLAAAVAGAGDARVLAVTVLTSLDETDLAADGNPLPVEDLVVRRALLAESAGCAGVVASPREVAAIRKKVRPDFLIVTPGVRAHNARGSDDQKRTATAQEARRAGADAVVVGRPIRDAEDPRAAALAFAAELESA